MSKPFTLIGLTGLAGTGKDTVADLLVTHCGFTKLAFADKLYAEIEHAFGVEQLYLKHRSTKEHPMTALALRKCNADGFVGRMIIHYGEQDQRLDLDAPRSPRQILQWWGTEYRRKQNPDYWTTAVNHQIKYHVGTRLASQFVVTGSVSTSWPSCSASPRARHTTS
jgi:hypothetical protein